MSATEMLGLRLNPHERTLIFDVAAREGVTVSALLREVAVPAITERAADRILHPYARRLTRTLREYFRPQLLRELTAGTAEGATETERILAALPDADPDTWLSDRASDLLAERAELVELARTDRPKAFKQALRIAAKELRGERN